MDYGYSMNMMKLNQNKKAFTMTEVVIVIILLATMTTLAVPRYTTVIEKTRSGEGLQILEALRKAQWAYYYENSNAFTSVLGDLDLDIPPMDSFLTPTVSTAAGSIATVVRSNNAYTLTIADDGDITCTGGAGICAQIGF